MSKETKHQTVKYSSLPLFNNPSFATHTIAGSINDGSYKEFRDFLRKVHDENQKIDDEAREYKEKEAFNKIHDPEAKPTFRTSKPKVERINLIIDSRGGSCSSMTNIVALMNASPIPIDTYCFGSAMSAGFMIFIHGKRRYIDRTANFMTHSLAAGVLDKVHEMLRYSTHLDGINKIYQDMIVSKTGLTIEWVQQHQDQDTFMLYEQILENKIADVLVVN